MPKTMTKSWQVANLDLHDESGNDKQRHDKNNHGTTIRKRLLSDARRRLKQKRKKTTARPQNPSQSGSQRPKSSEGFQKSRSKVYRSRVDRERVTEPTQLSSPRAAIAQQRRQLTDILPALDSSDDTSRSSQSEDEIIPEPNSDDLDTSEPDIDCLWDGAKSRAQKSKGKSVVLDHVKRVLAARVIASEAITSPWPSAIVVSHAIKEVWEAYVETGEMNGTLIRGNYKTMPNPSEAKTVQEWIASSKNYGMFAVRHVVACSGIFVGQDKAAVAERLLKRDDWIAPDLDNPKESRFQAPIIINALYMAWFSNPAAVGIMTKTRDYFLPLSQKLILFTCTMIRWAIMNERDTEILGKVVKTRFEGDQVQSIYNGLERRWNHMPSNIHHNLREWLSEQIASKATVNEDDVGPGYESEPGDVIYSLKPVTGRYKVDNRQEGDSTKLFPNFKPTATKSNPTSNVDSYRDGLSEIGFSPLGNRGPFPSRENNSEEEQASEGGERYGESGESEGLGENGSSLQSRGNAHDEEDGIEKNDGGGKENGKIDGTGGNDSVGCNGSGQSGDEAENERDIDTHCQVSDKGKQCPKPATIEKNEPEEGDNKPKAKRTKRKRAAMELSGLPPTKYPKRIIPHSLREGDFILTIKNPETPEAEPRKLKGNISNTVKVFKNIVGPHPLGDLAAIQGFWYRWDTTKPWVLFHFSDQLGPRYRRFLEDIKGSREVEAVWWSETQDQESP